MGLINADMLLDKAWDAENGFGWEKVVSVNDIKAAPTVDAVEVVRCNQCKHYGGVHDVPGCAPCAFWGIGGVMWDDFCKRGERWDG